MKFSHMADCHIGSWREPKLRDISTLAFIRAIDASIARNVDFVLISGDLFNTSLPALDRLKIVVKKLKELKDRKINTYIIAGSHDFSPSGKTILDVLEDAGLCINVVKGSVEGNKLKLKFTIDEKTGAKITGMLGKKGMLERKYYENLDKTNLEKEEGFKIFMFHTALSEFKPDDLEKMEAQPLSLLPKNFNYYAAGHVHYIFERHEEGYGIIAYPGALFPTNFKELEKFKNGGIYFYEDGKLSWEPIVIYNAYSIILDCSHKSPNQVEEELLNEIKGKEFINTIVTIRLEGKLSEGKPSEINFKDIFQKLYDKSAYFVMKNTNKLTSAEFEEINVTADTAEEVEELLIKEHLQQIKLENLTSDQEGKLTKALMKALNAEKGDGEKVADFERRIIDEVDKILKIE